MGKSTGRKTNEVEFEERMERIFHLMLYEHLGHDEFASKAAKEFGITTRQAENLWQEARQRMKQRYTNSQGEILENHLTQLYHLLERCKQEGNKLVERQVLADIAKIYGIEKNKIDITSGGQPISINIKME